jgi:hypothetical protein
VDILTDHVLPDEACHGLVEHSQWNGTEYRRVQMVFVVRGDSIARYETDLGPASAFPHAHETKIISLGDDSVAELMAEAEKDRHDAYWSKVAAELKEGSQLEKDWHQELETAEKIVANSSTFGPYVTKQRNNFSRS